MLTKAFKEGLHSTGGYKNPYPENSNEFDDYERGRTQKIKRSSNLSNNSTFSDYSFSEDKGPYKEWIDSENHKSLAEEILTEFRSYSYSKGK
jgi:hypothetical protein